LGFLQIKTKLALQLGQKLADVSVTGLPHFGHLFFIPLATAFTPPVIPPITVLCACHLRLFFTLESMSFRNPILFRLKLRPYYYTTLFNCQPRLIPFSNFLKQKVPIVNGVVYKNKIPSASLVFCFCNFLRGIEQEREKTGVFS
jgi:hypothetical protein